MNRRIESTPAPAGNGRAHLVAHGAHSRPGTSPRTRIGARGIVPCLGLILAALSWPAPALGQAFSASGSIFQNFYGTIPAGTPTIGPKKATFSQEYKRDDIHLVSRAEASGGHLSLFTVAAIRSMENWASGHVSAAASGRILEKVDPLWDLWASYGETFDFQYTLWVSGNTMAASTGTGAAGSLASVTYNYQVGDSSGGGTMTSDGAGGGSQSGTWNGVISNSFTVHKDSTFDLELVATAAGGGNKTYVPWSDATVSAVSDFSHTMRWLGITGVRAFDAGGNEVALPAGATLPLIGRDSGFDYWHAAPPAVPEPATVILFALGAAGLIGKSAVRRRVS